MLPDLPGRMPENKTEVAVLAMQPEAERRRTVTIAQRAKSSMTSFRANVARWHIRCVITREHGQHPPRCRRTRRRRELHVLQCLWYRRRRSAPRRCSSNQCPHIHPSCLTRMLQWLLTCVHVCCPPRCSWNDRTELETNPLMGWPGTSDALETLDMTFEDVNKAIAFAEKVRAAVYLCCGVCDRGRQQGHRVRREGTRRCVPSLYFV
jgi:ETC complex I subunit conserved region